MYICISLSMYLYIYIYMYVDQESPSRPELADRFVSSSYYRSSRGLGPPWHAEPQKGSIAIQPEKDPWQGQSN